MCASSSTLKSHWKIHKKGSGWRWKKNSWWCCSFLDLHTHTHTRFVEKTFLFFFEIELCHSPKNLRQAIIIIFHSGIIVGWWKKKKNVDGVLAVEWERFSMLRFRNGKINKQSKYWKFSARWQHGILSRKLLFAHYDECFMCDDGISFAITTCSRLIIICSQAGESVDSIRLFFFVSV